MKKDSSVIVKPDCNGPPVNCNGGNRCSVKAVCINTYPYTCKCMPGYKGDGKSCLRGKDL